MTKKYQELYDNQADARQLANNLFVNLNINFLSYARIELDGNSTLTSNANFTSELRKQSRCLSYQGLDKLLSKDSSNAYKRGGSYIFPCANRDNEQLMANLGLKDVALLIKKRKDSFDVFSFGSKNENYVSQLAFVNPNVFIQAKYDFLEKGQKLIKELKKVKIQGRKEIIIGSNKMAHNPEQFFKNSNTHFYYMSLDNGQEIRISNKERLVMLYLSHAQTVKEIAKSMNIAESTVNGHIENIKNKLGVYTRSDMMKFYLQSDFIFLDSLLYPQELKQ